MEREHPTSELATPKTYVARFAESTYGRSLSGRARWKRYMPETYSETDWIELLGSDADNLEHTSVALSITDWFLETDEGHDSLGITQQEVDHLRLAVVAHDWGESPDPETQRGGNKSYELKTREEEQREREMFPRVFGEIVGEDQVKLRYIIESIVFDKNSKLGSIFDAIERIGYIQTAVRAFELSKDESADPEVAQKLRWLTAGVMSNQILPLLGYAESYHPVRKFLAEHQEIIDEIFQNIKDAIFFQNGQTENHRRDLYDQAKAVWQRGIGSLSPRPKIEGETQDRGIFSSSANFERRFIPDYQELAKTIEACRRLLGLRVVLTSGSFDLLHIGHARYIEKAKQYGSLLVVGVDSDKKIRNRKGPHRPVVPQEERLKMIAHLRDVDIVTLKEPSETQWELIKTVRPDILIATAETYTVAEIEELEANYCGEVVVLEPQAVTSTSARLREINIKSNSEAIEPLLEAMERGAPRSELIRLVKSALNKNV